MKIALLFPNNVFTSPYVKYYTDILKKEKIKYDLYTWDRHDVKEEGCIPFKNKIEADTPITKSLEFIKFRRFLTKHLRNNSYHKVIVFTGQLGILMSDFLIKNYPNNYILDIRDFSKAINYFRLRFRRVVKNSYFVCISSNGFREWLPSEGNYILSHNICINLVYKRLNEHPTDDTVLENETINIDTIGQIKDYNSDARFIDQLKNDERFQMEFIGFGPALTELKKKSKTEKINNISYYGPYTKEEEQQLLKDTDLINILISRNNNNKGTTLLSNRLYLSAVYNIPCIVNGDTEQSKIIKKNNMGIVVNNYEELPEKVISFRDNFCRINFNNGCLSFLNEVKEDYIIFQDELVNFLKINNSYVQR